MSSGIFIFKKSITLSFYEKHFFGSYWWNGRWNL